MACACCGCDCDAERNRDVFVYVYTYSSQRGAPGSCSSSVLCARFTRLALACAACRLGYYPNPCGRGATASSWFVIRCIGWFRLCT
jgi:hypothetical protein